MFSVNSILYKYINNLYTPYITFERDTEIFCVCEMCRFVCTDSPEPLLIDGAISSKLS